MTTTYSRLWTPGCEDFSHYANEKHSRQAYARHELKVMIFSFDFFFSLRFVFDGVCVLCARCTLFDPNESVFCFCFFSLHFRTCT